MSTVAATSPYPWPYHGHLDARRMALVVAGAQPAWSSRSLRAGAVAGTIATLGTQLRSLGGLVVLVTHHSLGGRLASRCSGTWGGTLGGRDGLGPRPALPPAPGAPEAELLDLGVDVDLVVPAAGTSGFYGSDLDGELRRRGVDLLAMAGFGYEATVESTLRAANDRGYECLTLVDAVAPFEEGTGRHALSSITMSGGIFGAIGSATALAAALAGLP